MSASSRIMSLKPFLPPISILSSGTTHEKSTFVIAKLLICSRTTSMPRSSDAFSSRMCFRYAGPYSLRASARIVDVFPVPAVSVSLDK